MTASFALLTLSGLLVAGCGEAEPPPVTAGELEAAKKEREVIIRKEYGSGGFQAQAKKKK